MQLLLERQETNKLFIRSCTDEKIIVVDRELHESFMLNTQQVIEPWPVKSINELNNDLLAPIFALSPEVVLLGTGSTMLFPAQAIIAEFLGRGIGCEVMNNSAASRTFNLLAAEGRNVVAAFILGNALIETRVVSKNSEQA